jgi:RNA polymerase sigma factor (sigma-70 family)
MSTRPTDAELLAATGSDPRAFCQVYDRHVRAVNAYLGRQVGALSEDLTAEVFAQGWLSRNRFRDEADGSALPWLLGIARNVLRRSVRSQAAENRARRKLGLPVEGAVDPGFEAVDERISLPNAPLTRLAALPPEQREALELRVLHELGYDEIAARLGVQPAAARLRVSRALRRLRAAETTEATK